ncbi:Crp/Fnr family transcriptional regulator [Pelagibius litoralis]|uniref:Crp/Fnr family transcriptional regulator n=1 Tax=Pelagibius litoralis TaxID=374515 RepID=A0A967EYT3_9PROT|nr:Crp/Fnr family transcriptional regulator [Pelagibius litoralis]NIA69921.1 Crp/Fnr family transcriptional regulator [Pelagibius litoralis]
MQELQRVADGRAPFLPDYPPWNRLTAPSVSDLLDAATMISLTRGDDAGAGLGIVISGALAVERELSDGRRILCALFHEGDLVDLRRTERARQGDLIALKESEFLALDESRAEICTSEHADVARAFIVQLGDHLARMRDHATDLAFKTPFESLASVLFEFRRWPGADSGNPGGSTVRIPIPRGDVADYIGVKPETVSRAIRRLERERLIGIPEQDQVFLADIPSMRRLANGGRPRQSTRRS